MISALVLTVDLRSVIGFSSFGVLVYYTIANTAAATQTGQQRRWPRALNGLGALGCLALVATLPWQSVVAGTVMFAIGITGRAVVLTRRHGSPSASASTDDFDGPETD